MRQSSTLFEDREALAFHVDVHISLHEFITIGLLINLGVGNCVGLPNYWHLSHYHDILRLKRKGLHWFPKWLFLFCARF